MKRLLTLCFSLFVMGLGLQAQDHAAINQIAKERTEPLVLALDLTEEQQTLIHRQNYELAMTEARFEGMEGTDAEKKEMMSGYQKRFDDAVKGILTEEQNALYREMKAKEKKKR